MLLRSCNNCRFGGLPPGDSPCRHCRIPNAEGATLPAWEPHRCDEDDDEETERESRCADCDDPCCDGTCGRAEEVNDG
jgi:hypothetical protein